MICKECGKDFHTTVCDHVTYIAGVADFLSQVDRGPAPTVYELLHEIKLLKRQISEIRLEMEKNNGKAKIRNEKTETD